MVEESKTATQVSREEQKEQNFRHVFTTNANDPRYALNEIPEGQTDLGAFEVEKHMNEEIRVMNQTKARPHMNGRRPITHKATPDEVRQRFTKIVNFIYSKPRTSRTIHLDLFPNVLQKDSENYVQTARIASKNIIKNVEGLWQIDKNYNGTMLDLIEFMMEHRSDRWKNGIEAKKAKRATNKESAEKLQRDVAKRAIGLMPRSIWIERRVAEIFAAMKRYSEAQQVIPIEWIHELNHLFTEENK